MILSDIFIPKLRGVVTHSYDELKSRVKEVIEMKQNELQNPFPLNPSLIDPYRYGKEIDLFRDLLCAD